MTTNMKPVYLDMNFRKSRLRESISLRRVLFYFNTSQYFKLFYYKITSGQLLRYITI